MNAHNFVELFTLQTYAHLDDVLFQEVKKLQDENDELREYNILLTSQVKRLNTKVKDQEHDIEFWKKKTRISIWGFMEDNYATIIPVSAIIGCCIIAIVANNNV
jgi:hypothetical protein